MHSKTVLLVDDDPDFRFLMELWLTPDYQVLHHSNAEDLDRTIRSFSPDLVLLDVQMPGVDGIEACRVVRSHRDLSRLPLIFLTGSHDDKDFFKALDAGGTRWLNKPISRKDLLAVVAEETRP